MKHLLLPLLLAICSPAWGQTIAVSETGPLTASDVIQSKLIEAPDSVAEGKLVSILLPPDLPFKIEPAPANKLSFIDETTGHALLSDFGVARSIEPDSQLTATGTTIGTPAYMSPEQIDGGELDGRSDLYSLGLVGWEMLTGRRPWEGESLYSVIYKQKREELPPIDELRKDTPDRLIYLVEGATRKSPSDRWRSAGKCQLAHLRRALHGGDGLLEPAMLAAGAAHRPALRADGAIGYQITRPALAALEDHQRVRCMVTL